MTYTVTAPLVIVRDKDGADQYLYQGAELPDYVDTERRKQLEADGMVEKAKAERASSSRSRSTSSGKSGDGGDGGGSTPAGGDGGGTNKDGKGTAPSTGNQGS